MEGTLCYNPPSGCLTEGLTTPVFDYGRSEGNSITGGYVYRGPGVPELTGKYVYGDFGSGKIWALTIDGVPAPLNQLLIDTPLAIASFGVDAAGELYILEYKDPGAALYRFTPTTNVRAVESTSLPRSLSTLTELSEPVQPNNGYPLPTLTRWRGACRDLRHSGAAFRLHRRRSPSGGSSHCALEFRGQPDFTPSERHILLPTSSGRSCH